MVRSYISGVIRSYVPFYLVGILKYEAVAGTVAHKLVEGRWGILPKQEGRRLMPERGGTRCT